MSVLLFRASQVGGAIWPPLGYLIKQLNHLLTGADLAWQARIGPGLVLYHPTGVVIGKYVVMGENCRLQQGVTLGGLGSDVAAEGDSPVIGSGVLIGAGARVFGPIEVRDGAVVGANAVVNRDVPAGWIAVGVPAKIRPPNPNGGGAE